MSLEFTRLAYRNLELRCSYKCIDTELQKCSNFFTFLSVCVADGLDFFYSQKQDARKLVEFLQSIVPCRWVSLR